MHEKEDNVKKIVNLKLKTGLKVGMMQSGDVGLKKLHHSPFIREKLDRREFS